MNLKFIVIFISIFILISCNTFSVTNDVNRKTDINPLDGKWGGEVRFEIKFQLLEENQIKCIPISNKGFRSSSGHRLKSTFWVVNNKVFGYFLLAGKIIEIEEFLDENGSFSFKDQRVYLTKLTEFGRASLYLDVSGGITLNNAEKSSFGTITISEFGKSFECGGSWRLYQHWK